MARFTRRQTGLLIGRTVLSEKKVFGADGGPKNGDGAENRDLKKNESLARASLMSDSCQPGKTVDLSKPTTSGPPHPQNPTGRNPIARQQAPVSTGACCYFGICPGTRSSSSARGSRAELELRVPGVTRAPSESRSPRHPSASHPDHCADM